MALCLRIAPLDVFIVGIGALSSYSFRWRRHRGGKLFLVLPVVLSKREVVVMQLDADDGSMLESEIDFDPRTESKG